MEERCHKYVLKAHFDGEPKETDLQLEEEILPELEDGDVLFKAEYLSADPYMRFLAKNLQIGETMMGCQLSRVVKTRNDNYPIGSKYICEFGWRTHTVSKPHHAAMNSLGLQECVPLHELRGFPESFAMGTLGISGLTAFFGLLKLCDPKVGDVVLVNSAAGAIGNVVGQIAKIKGCTTIGSTGRDEKVRWLKEEVGFDFAFNYKTTDLNSALKQAAPDGIDCFFDNVGGEFAASVIKNHMKPMGRIACCGSISSYSAADEPQSSAIFFPVILQQLKIEGFLITRFLDEFEVATAQLMQWAEEGKLTCYEHRVEGFANIRDVFYGLLQGRNIGKAIVQIV